MNRSTGNETVRLDRHGTRLCMYLTDSSWYKDDNAYVLATLARRGVDSLTAHGIERS